MSTFNSVSCSVARTREPVTSNLAAEMISLFGESHSLDDDGKKKKFGERKEEADRYAIRKDLSVGRSTSY